MMLKLSRQTIVCVLGLFLVWGFYLGRSHLHLTSAVHATGALFGISASIKSPLSPHVHTYFDQVFAIERPAQYNFPAIKAACARTEWKEENKDVYLRCGDMAAGMTSILSQVKVCFKMAVDAGVHIVLPAMPLRDSDDLTEFNFLNESAYMTYDQWFDSEHLISSMARACPQLRIRHPKELDTPAMPVASEEYMDIATAPGYKWLAGYFWVGRPFKVWFDEELLRIRSTAKTNGTRQELSDKKQKPGATIIKIASQFLIYRITDDATGRDLALWNDISHLVRFKEEPRAVTAKILSLINGPFIGLHFRTESDSIWSSFETQLERDLDMLDKVGSRYGKADGEKPLVYLACGDESQIIRFTDAAKPRGWTVTSKYDLVKDDPDTLARINKLPFDFQGAIDMGIMLKSHFFVGLMGSAFSSTIANMRDATGRYRGSSVLFPDDGNARTHLFNDGDASSYACCL